MERRRLSGRLVILVRDRHDAILNPARGLAIVLAVVGFMVIATLNFSVASRRA